MKQLKLIIALLVLMPAAAGSAWADRGHDHFHSHIFWNIGIGPVWGPGYYYPPYPYYYSPPVVIQSPPVYIEQPQSAPAPAASNYWYYCPASKRYYPYVSECPSGWQQVSPTPPDAR